MKVEKLIEELKKYPNDFEVCLCVNESTGSLQQVRGETFKTRCYDKGDHILEFLQIDRCVMLGDFIHDTDSNGYIL